MNDAFFCKVQKYEQLYNEYKNDYVEVKKIKNELRNQLEEQNIINQELQSAENEKNNLEHQLRNKRKKDKQKCESGIQKCDNSLMNLLTKQKNDLKNELDTNEKNIALFNKNAVKDMSAAFVSQIVEREEDDFNRNKARKIQLDEKIVATEQEIRLIEKNNDELSTLSMEDIKQDIDYLKNKGGKISEYSKDLILNKSKQILTTKYMIRSKSLKDIASGLNACNYNMDVAVSKVATAVVSMIYNGEMKSEKQGFILRSVVLLVISIITCVLGVVSVVNSVIHEYPSEIFSALIGISGIGAMLCAMVYNNALVFSNEAIKKIKLNFILYGVMIINAIAIIFFNTHFVAILIGIVIGMIIYGFLLDVTVKSTIIPLTDEEYIVYDYCNNGRSREIIAASSEQLFAEMFQKNTTGSYFYSKENSIINEAIEHLDDILSECEKHEQKTKRLNELVKNNAEYKEELELINKKIYTYQNIHSGEEVRRIEDKVKLKFADVNYPDLTYVDVAYDIVNGIPGFDKNRIINTANVIEKKYKELLENNSKLNKALEEVIEGKYRRTSEYLELISEKNDYEKKLKNYSAFDFDKTPDYVELEKKCEKLSKQFSEIQIKGAKLEQKKQDIEEKLLPKKTTIQNYMSKNFFENTKTNRSKITPYIPLGFSLDKDIDVHKINYIKHDFKPCIIKYNDSMIENDGLVNFIANAIFGVVINDVDQNKLYKVELIDTSGRLIQISNTQSIKRLVAGNYLEYVKDSSSATMLLKALNKERSELGMSLEDHNEICIEKHRENNIKPYVLLIINENLGNINSWRDTFVQIVNNSEYWGIIPIIFTSNSEYDERIFLEVFKNTINFIELDSFVRANNHDEMRLILEDINFTVENYKF